MTPKRQAELKTWAARRVKMRAMREAGKTLKDIGDYFGITKQRVSQHLKG